LLAALLQVPCFRLRQREQHPFSDTFPLEYGVLQKHFQFRKWFVFPPRSETTGQLGYNAMSTLSQWNRRIYKELAAIQAGKFFGMLSRRQRVLPMVWQSFAPQQARSFATAGRQTPSFECLENMHARLGQTHVILI